MVIAGACLTHDRRLEGGAARRSLGLTLSGQCLRKGVRRVRCTGGAARLNPGPTLSRECLRKGRRCVRCTGWVARRSPGPTLSGKRLREGGATRALHGLGREDGVRGYRGFEDCGVRFADRGSCEFWIREGCGGGGCASSQSGARVIHHPGDGFARFIPGQGVSAWLPQQKSEFEAAKREGHQERGAQDQEQAALGVS